MSAQQELVLDWRAVEESREAPLRNCAGSDNGFLKEASLGSTRLPCFGHDRGWPGQFSIWTIVCPDRRSLLICVATVHFAYSSIHCLLDRLHSLPFGRRFTQIDRDQIILGDAAGDFNRVTVVIT